MPRREAGKPGPSGMAMPFKVTRPVRQTAPGRSTSPPFADRGKPWSSQTTGSESTPPVTSL